MEIEKQLAFMQYINEPYFKISYEDEDIFYVGNFIQIAREYIEYRNECKTTVEDYICFADWLDEYIYTVEDYLFFNYKDLGDDYLILTNEEADEKWEESLDNYIDECILPEIPEAYRRYFDNDSFKFDAKFDGRGHSLSSYDGIENEEYVKEFNQTFYIYKITMKKDNLTQVLNNSNMNYKMGKFNEVPMFKIKWKEGKAFVYFNEKFKNVTDSCILYPVEICNIAEVPSTECNQKKVIEMFKNIVYTSPTFTWIDIIGTQSYIRGNTNATESKIQLLEGLNREKERILNIIYELRKFHFNNEDFISEEFVKGLNDNEMF